MLDVNFASYSANRKLMVCRLQQNNNTNTIEFGIYFIEKLLLYKLTYFVWIKLLLISIYFIWKICSYCFSLDHIFSIVAIFYINLYLMKIIILCHLQKRLIEVWRLRNTEPTQISHFHNEFYFTLLLIILWQYGYIKFALNA